MMFFSKLKKALPRRSASARRGFTLAELLVSIAVILILFSVTFVDYEDFIDTVDFSNITYDVALTVREAQALGSGVRSGSGGSFDSSYGVYFEIDSSKFVIFVDGNENNEYDDTLASCDGECIRLIEMGRGVFVDHICRDFVVKDPVTDEFISGSQCDNEFHGFIHIAFTRPDLDAHITYETPGVGSHINTGTRIVLQSLQGDQHKVIITNTGQISVE